MDRNMRKEEATQANEETTDRRDFLKQAGMIGGGALAAIAGITSNADAQRDIRIGPEGRMAPTLENILNIPARDDVASVEEFTEVFRQIREECTEQNADTPECVAQAMSGMSPADRVAGTAILQMRARFPKSPNVGQNLVILFQLLGAGVNVMPGDRANPRALGNSCGNGCGNNCGNGCMSAVASGFICGDGCGQGCNGAESAGLMCGGGCEATGLKQLSFDREGVALKGVKLTGLDLRATAAAMRNADRAYNESGLASAPADKPDW